MPRRAKRRVELTLPFPPSVNSYWRRNGHRYYIGAKGREFREYVTINCSARTPLTGRLSVSITLIMPDRKQRDVDNYHKGLLDALEHAGIFLNDNQVDKISIARAHVAPPGCCRVAIREL